MRSRLSTTTRNGSFAGSPGCRTVSWGSSASTVPIPTRTASAANLSRWPSSRAASPVIHRDAPSAAAILPSSVMAALSVTCGRPSVTAQRNARFSARASASRTPTVTLTPAARSRARPRPSTSGCGSPMAATTRATPARTSASAHGGVRPKWAHGSSVT